MQSKQEIETQISLLKNELADLEKQLENYDIQIGDLILVIAKKSWDTYTCVVRVCSVSQDIIEGDTLHTDGFVNPASFSFDKNTFIKISI
jgi:hypothetical protein